MIMQESIMLKYAQTVLYEVNKHITWNVLYFVSKKQNFRPAIPQINYV